MVAKALMLWTSLSYRQQKRLRRTKGLFQAQSLNKAIVLYKKTVVAEL